MQTYLKAITAAVLAGLIALKLTLADDILTWDEGVTVAIAILTSFAGVWAVPNQEEK